MQVEHFKLIQDIDGCFDTFQSRIGNITAPLPRAYKAELEDEIELLKASILNHVKKCLKD